MRILNALPLFLLLSSPLHAADLPAALQSCLQLTADHARLQCYDKIAQKLQVQPVVVTEQVATTATTAIPAVPVPVQVPAPSQTATATATAQHTESQFGLKQKDASELIGSISAKVLSVDETGLKKLEIQLDNQQIWRQQDAERVDVRTGDTCIVRSGSLKSFLMECERRKKSFRVRRVD